MESTKDTRLVREITLQNILSFGPDTPSLPLQNLNLLIGPNASGKSNLIECLDLLRHSTTDIRALVEAGGGVAEWVWKGVQGGTSLISVVLNSPDQAYQLKHSLWFAPERSAFRLRDETIQKLHANEPAVDIHQRHAHGSTHDAEPALSILAQLDHPTGDPDIAYLVDAYKQIAIYREWYFGRNASLRRPQSLDMQNSTLEEDFSNLGSILQRLQTHPEAKRTILDNLQDLYDGVTDFHVSVSDGNVRVSFTEGDFQIPATRLSAGTLRYLCLLAILCDPTPPRLICIDEPELSLHPDMLPKIADLLIEASQRTQLIITTHSDILVDAMTECPESVVICDKHEGHTTMKRLDRSDLAHWLEDFRLGELWTRGELGGTRW